MTPCAEFPAGTLVGDIAVCTVIVNCGVTARTVKPCGGVVKVVVGPVPVMAIP